MRVVFAHSFDQGAYPGPLSERDAVLGEAWVGELGLLKIVETMTGMGGVHAEVTLAERAASLVPRLRARAGAWSASLEVDPLAVARAVMRQRDVLVESGLRPDDDAHRSALPERLREIVEVCAGIVPGVVDRVRSCIAALDRRAHDLESVTTYTRIDALPFLWRALLHALERRGVRVLERHVDEAASAGDLLASRRAPFSPGGDGTLWLLRSDTPEEAATEVGAHLAVLRDRDPTQTIVILDGDVVLDAGLARLAQPTIGARGERGDDGLLQVAPLVVALAWPERDPERALELLSLSSSPIRRRVAFPLARALHDQPAVDSDAWRDALARVLPALTPEDQEKTKARLESIFGKSEALAHEMPLSVVLERLDLVRAWAHGRLSRLQPGASPGTGEVPVEERLEAAIRQVNAIARVVKAFGVDRLSRTELMRLVEEATASIRAARVQPALAGIGYVGDPASMVGAADHVVWWNFTAAREHHPYALAVTRDERAKLVELGITLRDPATVAENRGEELSRPLSCAKRSLILVCPRRDVGGDAAHPHPLWDEIVARAGGDDAIRRLEVAALPLRNELPRKFFRARDVARPQVDWALPPSSAPPREVDSVTDRETFIGCTFRGVLERVGLKEKRRRLKEGTQLFGELAHDVLARVFQHWPVSPEEAAALARTIYDERVPRRAAILDRPIEATQKMRGRALVARAAEDLTAILRARKLDVIAVEHEIIKGPPDRRLKGRLDVLVGQPLIVIDLKSGSDRARRRSLETGTAVQLALYAALAKPDDGPWPGIAYYQIRSRRLLTTDTALGGAATIEPLLTQDQIALQVKKLAITMEQEVMSGIARAPGVYRPISQIRSKVNEERQLEIAPPCRFCALSLLCGRALPGGDQRR